MGVEDRDWYRDEPKPRRAIRVSSLGGGLIVAGVVVGLVIAGALQAMTKGSPATYGGEESTHQGATKISLLPGLPSLLHRASAVVFVFCYSTSYSTLSRPRRG